MMSGVTSATAPLSFQQDGALLRFNGEVCRYLRIRHRDRLVGRAALISWPPRSPDLTPPHISYGDLLSVKCTFHFCLQMLIYEQELQAQLQKSCKI
jgi:hypothetical protein